MCEEYAEKSWLLALGTCLHILGDQFLNSTSARVFHTFSPGGLVG